MDQKQILLVMHDAFKSLTVSHLELLEFEAPLMTVRLVAEGYSHLNIPERVTLLTEKLRQTSSIVSLNYAIAFEPLTPSEYSDWFEESDSSDHSNGSSGDGLAAKSVEL